MKKYTILIIIIILGAHIVVAETAEGRFFTSIKYIEAEKKGIHLVIDFEKNVINLKRLLINREIPIGILKLDFLENYSVPITSKLINEKNYAIIKGSDWYDGIGTKIEITFKTTHSIATIHLVSQFEELWITYVPQLVPIKIIKK